MPSFYTKEYASTYHVRCPLITMDRLSELDNYSIVIFPNKILYTVCDELIRTYELKKDYFRINSSVFSAYIINRSE